MRTITLGLLMMVTASGCEDRYSGFPKSIRDSAVQREGETPKEEVIAKTKQLKVGMTSKEVRELLVEYDVGLGKGSNTQKERSESLYLLHGILVDVKYDGQKGDDDKVTAFEIGTFKGW